MFSGSAVCPLEGDDELDLALEIPIMPIVGLTRDGHLLVATNGDAFPAVPFGDYQEQAGCASFLTQPVEHDGIPFLLVTEIVVSFPDVDDAEAVFRRVLLPHVESAIEDGVITPASATIARAAYAYLIGFGYAYENGRLHFDGWPCQHS